MLRSQHRIQAVDYVTDGTGSDTALVDFVGALAGDVVCGFTLNFTAVAHPISNAGATLLTGATSPSGSSAGNAGWFLAATAAPDVTCSGGITSRFQRFGFRGARMLRGAAIQATTGSIHNIPAVKQLRHGGRFFVSTMTETASRSVSSDDLGLGAAQASSISGYSRHRWIGPQSLASYPGGSFTLNGSAECWTIYGWAA